MCFVGCKKEISGVVKACKEARLALCTVKMGCYEVSFSGAAFLMAATNDSVIR